MYGSTFGEWSKARCKRRNEGSGMIFAVLIIDWGSFYLCMCKQGKFFPVFFLPAKISAQCRYVAKDKKRRGKRREGNVMHRLLVECRMTTIDFSWKD